MFLSMWSHKPVKALNRKLLPFSFFSISSNEAVFSLLNKLKAPWMKGFFMLDSLFSFVFFQVVPSHTDVVGNEMRRFVVAGL